MSGCEDQWNVLYEAKQVAEAGYVTLDTETTSLAGEVIQWAVCAPDGSVLGQGYVKPTVPISEGARAIHGITDEMLMDAPTFDVVAPQIWSLIGDKTLVVYNADFDMNRLDASLSPYVDWENPECPYRGYQSWIYHRRLRSAKKSIHCAMEWFATIYGQIHEYYKTYTWQKLETACAYFNIPQGQAHDAASDASATALLVTKLAEMAEQELPKGYHPPREEPCTGGCGQTLGWFSYNENKTWYCAECGLKAGINHLCTRCQEKGKRTIVTSLRSETEVLPPDKLCSSCEYEVNMASGAWHACPICNRHVRATLEQQRLCAMCQYAEEERIAKQRVYRKSLRERRRNGTLTEYEQYLLDRWASMEEADMGQQTLGDYYIHIDGASLGLPQWGTRVIARREVRIHTKMREPIKYSVWYRGKRLYVQSLEKHRQMCEAVSIAEDLSPATEKSAD